MMTERDIQLILFKCLQGTREAMIPNCYLTYGEADLIGFTKAKYMHEYEIKISKSDFKADFKNKFSKHLNYKKIIISGLDFQKHFINIPNYFNYVCPKGLIDVADIPEYAGLIYVNESYNILEPVKSPPKLHKRKFTEAQINKYLQNLYWKYWNLCKKLNQFHSTKEPWLEFMEDMNNGN